MSPEFIGGIDNEVGRKIQCILRGEDACIASAFLGRGASGLISEGSRVICNVVLGGTNPAELRELSEKIGENLRHIPALHAKVYISDVGCLVGSANLSANGVGFFGIAGLQEAAVFVDVQDPTTKSARTWFDSIWNTSFPIGENEILIAEAAWKSGNQDVENHNNYEGFIDALRHENGEASNWQYIVTRDELRGQEAQEAERIIQEQGLEWLLQDQFGDWFSDLHDSEELSGRYVALHRGPRGGLQVKVLEFLANLPGQNALGTISCFRILPQDLIAFMTLNERERPANGPISNAIRDCDVDELLSRPITAQELLQILQPVREP